MGRTLAEYTRPFLTGYQLRALFCPERYAVVEATTKSGKTAGCMAWLLEQALQGQPGRNYWWTAPILEQAKIPFGRMRRGLPRPLYEVREMPPTLTLANGATIVFKGADNPDSLYGEDVYAAVIDEASRVREEAWHAVRSTLTATRGPIRIIGNVKGRRNWAYTLARRAESGERDWHYAKITAYDAIEAGILDAAEIADAKRDLPDAVFRELYLAEPSDDQGNPFGLAAIAACVGPVSAEQPVAFGVDLAKSQDWTVVIGLDSAGRVAHYDRWQAPWEMTTPRVEAPLGRTPAYVDSTGVGDPIVERLQKDGCAGVEGYHFSGPSKQALMEGLAVALQQHEITYPDGPIRQELEQFEYVYTRTGVRYSAPEGLHDDCVMALALAVAKWRRLPRLRPFSASAGAERDLMAGYVAP